MSAPRLTPSERAAALLAANHAEALKAELRERQEHIERQSAAIARLEDELRERDERLERQRANLEARAEENAKLRAQVSDLAGEVARLKRDVEIERGLADKAAYEHGRQKVRAEALLFALVLAHGNTKPLQDELERVKAEHARCDKLALAS